MLLKKLVIERKLWGATNGQFAGSITFDGEAGSVSLKLTPDLCNKIFAVCAEGIVSTAKEAARNLACNIIEHAEVLGIEATK